MKLEEAIERCNELIKEKHANWIGLTSQEAISTVLQEIEHLQKDSINKEKLIEIIDFGINATDSNDNYSIGMCNGMIYIKSIITDGNPNYKKCQNNSISKDKIRDCLEDIEDYFENVSVPKEDIEFIKEKRRDLLKEE